MFRKPKRKTKDTLRRKDDETREAEEETIDLVADARKKTKTVRTSRDEAVSSNLLPTFEPSNDTISPKDLATRTAQHLPESTTVSTKQHDDGVFRDKSRNPFHAGPIQAPANIRVTARFDYQPDICKDYKETGFCGYGDTCIYLHDRGDTLTGWQLEQQWEQEQKIKKENEQKALEKFMGKRENEEEQPEDGIPFACNICREWFKEPVVTACQHYFCQACILNHVKNVSSACPICQKDMRGVFHEPAKLIAKKRKVLGVSEAKAEDSWQRFFETKGRPPQLEA